MVIGAILLVANEMAGAKRHASPRGLNLESRDSDPRIPLACMEVVGRSVLLRTIARLEADGVGPITIVASDDLSPLVPALPTRSVEISLVRPPAGPWLAANRTLTEYAEQGIGKVLLLGLGGYVEFDLAELLQFHHSRMHPVTRAYDRHGRLDFWIIDSARYLKSGVEFDGSFSLDKRLETVPYFMNGYVNRLRDARDFRRLGVDALLHRCAIKPDGIESKPGVWMGEDARVHRHSRLVAPAFVGSGTRVEDDTLITRCSVIERNCRIDYGTVVEDCSILPDTYAGACLDFSHAVVVDRTVIDLRRRVAVEVDDPALLEKVSSRKEGTSKRSWCSSLANFGHFHRSKHHTQLVS